MNLFLKVWIQYYIVFYTNLQKWSRNPLFPSTKVHKDSLDKAIEDTEKERHRGDFFARLTNKNVDPPTQTAPWHTFNNVVM